MEHLRIYNTLDSTNLEAHRLLASGPVANGFTILTKQQTAGLGQYGRQWLAEENKHLAMSIILVPHRFPVSELPLVGMKTNLGIVMALKKIDPQLDPKIKWPNDVYLQGKKICGILLENAIAGQHVQHIIIGIGMNVNERQFPESIPNAISLYNTTGIKHDLYEVAHVIREHVLEQVDISDLYWKQAYDACLFGKEKEFSFEHHGQSFRGKVKGVDEQGRIILSSAPNKMKEYYSHEIKWLMI